MKKLLALIFLVPVLSCASKENTTIEQAFIAISVIESFVMQHKDDEDLSNKNCLNTGGTFTYAVPIGTNNINGFIASSCEFEATDNILSLKNNCSKSKNPIISLTIDIYEANVIKGGLKFEGLLNIEKTCSYRLEYSDENYTTLTGGRICGYDVTEILDAGFSYSNPSSSICTYLN